MSDRTLAPSLAAACARWAERPALTADGATVTYAELEDRVQRLAAAYVDLGLRPGDRVVCQMPNGIGLVVAAHAAWACGAVHVGVDRDLTAPERTAVVERTGAAAVVHDGTVTVVGGRRTTGDAAPTLAALMAGPRRPLEPREPARRSPAGCDLLLLTSGTTGRPKAVMETLPWLRAKMRHLADTFSPGPDDVHLGCLPLAHAFGLKLALIALASGGRLVLVPRFSPDDALRLVGDEGVTVLPGTPTHFTLLTSRLVPGRHRLATLRWAVSAAAPMPPRLVEPVLTGLGVGLTQVYGCSEGFLVVTTDGDDIRRGSVGRNAYRGPEGSPPDGSLAVVDPETRAPVPAGEVGEIVFGAARPVRYWGEPAVATDGWYRTGDLGRVDGEGRLYVTGRLKDVVNRGGLKVAAGEVEAVLARHPAVAECAVVPAPDPVLGEAICACIVPASDTAPDLAEVRSFLGDSLARHKLPDEVRVLPALPRSKIGKLDRGALARLVGGGDAPAHRVPAG